MKRFLSDFCVNHETIRYTYREMPEPTQKQRIGRLGEDIAIKYLENKGFSIKGLNYRKKCGEIDIIAQKGKILHFIEVKTVTHETLHMSNLCNVSCVTDKYRPEDNIHEHKLMRLARTIQVYLLEKYPKGEPEWQFSAIVVQLDTKNRQAKVRFLEDLVL